MEKSPRILLQAEEVVETYTKERISEQETRLGILAQWFFNNLDDMSDLSIDEFLEYQAKPLITEIDSYLDF